MNSENLNFDFKKKTVRNRGNLRYYQVFLASKSTHAPTTTSYHSIASIPQPLHDNSDNHTRDSSRKSESLCFKNPQGPSNGGLWTCIAGVLLDPQNGHFWGVRILRKFILWKRFHLPPPGSKLQWPRWSRTTIQGLTSNIMNIRC